MLSWSTDHALNHPGMPESDWVPLAILIHGRTGHQLSIASPWPGRGPAKTHRKTAISEVKTLADTLSLLASAAALNRPRPREHKHHTYEQLFGSSVRS